MNEFIPGQRWISTTESELGLGLILEAEINRITVLFLASGEKRIYAKDNAPLTRVKFGIGDVIESTDYLKITIQQVEHYDGLLSYIGLDEDGQLQQIDEMELNHHIQFNKPQDRLFTGQFDPTAWFLLRYETWLRQQKHQQSAVKGLQGARAALIPHQLFIAQQAANRSMPRIMLADEVGLGKTIEAGLIIHRRLINGLSRRILILVPDSLLHQWLVEMLRRFNLKFSIFDESRCTASSEDNPFQSEQLVLCSQHFFVNYPHRQVQVLNADWDLVVVDEAHHLQWSEDAPSPEYQFVEQLALDSPGLILLTATPEQLGKESHFARLRLLDPDRFYQFQQFVEEECQFEPVAQLANLLISDEKLNSSQQDRLRNLLKNDKVEKLLSQVNEPTAVGPGQARDELIKLLLDHHGTGRILFRNSRHTVKGFPDRECFAYKLTGDDSSDLQHSPYLIWLVEKLKALGDEKALLICKKAETVVQLEQLLRLHVGHTAAVFHEGMSIVERDRAAAFFVDEESRAQVLICSEIGSEGRNFQFVRHLILFDLPENPDLLQQRIGRLDRIGQKHVIQIHVPFLEHSAQQVLFRWYNEGLDAFRHNCSAAAQVYKTLGEDLRSVLNKPETASLENLIAKTRTLNQQLETELQKGRDVLLELNSCRQDEAHSLVEQIDEVEKDPAFWPYMEAIFDCYGVDVEYHSRDCHILWPSENLRIAHFPMLQDDGLTITLKRDIALTREDMQFITVEHPMVLSAMDLVLSSETGNAAVSVVKHPQLKAGQFLLELLFVVECSAPAQLQIGRFLPATPIRILIDQHKKDLTAFIQHETLVETEDNFDKGQISQFLNSQRQHIMDMLKTAELSANTQMRNLIVESSNRLVLALTAEIKRLVRLRQINPGIKEQEIEQLKETTLLSHESIQDAQLRLDAVRFVITS